MTKELEPYLEKSNDYLEGYRDGITFIMNFFEKLKDIDFTELEKEVAEEKQAEPIGHGHWTEDCRCSKCGAEAITEWNETGGAWVMTPFCPFCGAEMEMDGEIAR